MFYLLCSQLQMCLTLDSDVIRVRNNFTQVQ